MLETVPPVVIPERPALAPGVELVGELTGVSYTERQWLVQRDGQYLQLTELLYRLAECANGERTVDEIAAAFTEATPWAITSDQVQKLLVTRLIPAGVVALDEVEDDDEIVVPDRRANAPLALTLRKQVMGANAVDVLARVLQFLYNPIVIGVLVAAAAAAHAWIYLNHGLRSAVNDVLYTPGLLLVVFGLTVFTSVFHELGHAAALRYGGGRARGIGVGIYLVYPAYYTDTTDVYRLGRWARVRTDLGGLYFELIASLAAIAAFAYTGEEVLLILVLLINAGMLNQLLPFVRFDGYWALADLTGVPDFFTQSRAFVRSLLRRPGAHLPSLRRGAQIAFAIYLAVTFPVLAVFLVLMLKNLPWTLSTTWDALRMHADAFSAAWTNADLLSSAATAVEMLLLFLPILGIAYLLYSLIWRPGVALVRWLAARLAASPLAWER
jgi:putative peptide zinc metalloprotease protein